MKCKIFPPKIHFSVLITLELKYIYLPFSSLDNSGVKIDLPWFIWENICHSCDAHLFIFAINVVFSSPGIIKTTVSLISPHSMFDSVLLCSDLMLFSSKWPQHPFQQKQNRTKAANTVRAIRSKLSTITPLHYLETETYPIMFLLQLLNKNYLKFDREPVSTVMVGRCQIHVSIIFCPTC